MSPSATSPEEAGVEHNARAAIVNRTHRVVRERALAMQTRKRAERDLLVPCLVCSVVLLLMDDCR